MSAQVQVIATTPEGTAAALVEAQGVAHRLGVDRMTLLVPRTPSLSEAIADLARAEPVIDDYRTMASRSAVAVSVRFCLCGGNDEALRRLVPAGAVVVVGGRRRWWWPTREQRLAETARRSGHHTIFADVTRTSVRP